MHVVGKDEQNSSPPICMKICFSLVVLSLFP